jgi:hypothetical protein
MAKGVQHFTADGKPYHGGMHKMPDGALHSGEKHSDSSVPLFHFGELSKKAQDVARTFRKKKGGEKGGEKGSMKKSQRSLKRWSKEKWRTKSGKPSGETGERYMPEKAIGKLSAAEYIATSKKKKKGSEEGEQFVKNTKAAAKAVKSSRIKPKVKRRRKVVRKSY